MQEEDIADSRNSETLVGRRAKSLNHASRKKHIVGLGQASLVEARDADARTEGAEETREDELGAFPVLLCENGYDGAMHRSEISCKVRKTAVEDTSYPSAPTTRS